MKLHELEENKIYIGEDGLEYMVSYDSMCKLCSNGRYVATRLSVLTQNFTPKKEEPIVR